MKGKGFRSIICRCSWAVAVYNIWLERNQSVFQQKAVCVEQLTTVVLPNVTEFLSSFRLVKTLKRIKIYVMCGTYLVLRGLVSVVLFCFGVCCILGCYSLLLLLWSCSLFLCSFVCPVGCLAWFCAKLGV